jgi:hypothetical protein
VVEREAEELRRSAEETGERHRYVAIRSDVRIIPAHEAAKLFAVAGIANQPVD